MRAFANANRNRSSLETIASGFLVVAQGKLLGLDNKQNSGAPSHPKTRAGNVELTAIVLDCGSILPLFSSKIEDVMCKKSDVR